MPLLENWTIVGEPPHKCHLTGQVYGHPDHRNGTFVTTSRIVGGRGREVETMNTVYELGTPHWHYRQWYEEKYCKPLNEESPFPG